MANHCSNFLRVSQTNKSKAAQEQLRKFVDDVYEKGKKLNTKEAKKFREEYLTEQFENRYRNNLPLYVEHNEMPIKNFMERVAFYRYDKDKKVFTTGESFFDTDKILPVPAELRQPFPEGISEKEQKKILEERILNV